MPYDNPNNENQVPNPNRGAPRVRRRRGPVPNGYRPDFFEPAPRRPLGERDHEPVVPRRP